MGASSPPVKTFDNELRARVLEDAPRGVLKNPRGNVKVRWSSLGDRPQRAVDSRAPGAVAQYCKR